MGFIKFIEKSSDFESLIRTRPTAFVLLSLIAQRANRQQKKNADGCEYGEALIGDYENYGVTRQQYRTDKKLLEKCKFSTFKTTTNGTVAKIVSTGIFDIRREDLTNRSTNDQPTTNQQLTTNRDIRDKNKEINTVDYLLNLPFEDLETFKTTYTLFTENEIRLHGKKAYSWCKSEGKKYKDYRHFFHNWLRRSEEWKKEKQQPEDKLHGYPIFKAPEK